MKDIKFVDSTKTNQIKYMWKYCFGDSDEFVNWLFRKVYQPENTLASFRGDKVAANLQIYPYDISLSGKAAKIGYIAGVATLPQYRGEGHVKALMNKSLEEMYNRGCHISLLIPFNFEFYRKYGFECCYHLETYEGNMKSLKKFRLKGEYKEYDKAPIEIYEKYVQNKNGHIIRDEKIFNEIYEDSKIGGGHFYILKDGGYLIYTIEDDTFNVLEMAFVDIDALHSLLGFIYSHSSQVNNFKIRTVSDGFLGNMLCEKDINEKRFPHAMARVVNVYETLKLLSYECKGEVVLEIFDPLIPQNNGSFKVSNEGVTKSEGGAFMSIETFTRLALSKISPDEALMLGLIENAESIKPLFNKKVNYVNMLGWV